MLRLTVKLEEVTPPEAGERHPSRVTLAELNVDVGELRGWELYRQAVTGATTGGEAIAVPPQ